MIDIAKVAKVGQNVVTIERPSPFTIYHELEPAYVLGSFALKPIANGLRDRPGSTASNRRRERRPRAQPSIPTARCGSVAVSATRTV